MVWSEGEVWDALDRIEAVQIIESQDKASESGKLLVQVNTNVDELIQESVQL